VILSLACKTFIKTIVRNGTLLALLNAGLALSAADVLAKDEFRYDPATCKTGAKGHFYIALGKYVFAVPFRKNGVIEVKVTGRTNER
jgi:hypothetical protein